MTVGNSHRQTCPGRFRAWRDTALLVAALLLAVALQACGADTDLESDWQESRERITDQGQSGAEARARAEATDQAKPELTSRGVQGNGGNASQQTEKSQADPEPSEGAGEAMPKPEAIGEHAVAKVEFASVSSGYAHTCGVRTDGSVSCWGRDSSGEATPPAGEFASVSGLARK